jgi:hypothetical protein
MGPERKQPGEPPLSPHRNAAPPRRFFPKNCTKGVDTPGIGFYILQNVKDVTRVGAADDSPITSGSVIGAGFHQFQVHGRGRG